MTWLKTGDEFPDECAAAGLSDAAYRTHHEGLSWVMRRETGGDLTDRDVRRFAETDDPEAAIKELVAARFWKVTSRGWRIVKHMDQQPSPEAIRKRREQTAERTRRYRENREKDK